MSSPEYVKKPEGMTLEELKECVEWLIENNNWWDQTEYLNQMNISNPPDKLEAYLNSGGRYFGVDEYSQRYSRFRAWYISVKAKVTVKPAEPCLQVLNGTVTIVNRPPAVPTTSSPDDLPGLKSTFKLYISKSQV